jgi:hypothetical protein
MMHQPLALLVNYLFYAADMRQKCMGYNAE